MSSCPNCQLGALLRLEPPAAAAVELVVIAGRVRERIRCAAVYACNRCEFIGLRQDVENLERQRTTPHAPHTRS